LRRWAEDLLRRRGVLHHAASLTMLRTGRAEATAHAKLTLPQRFMERPRSMALLGRSVGGATLVLTLCSVVCCSRAPERKPPPRRAVQTVPRQPPSIPAEPPFGPLRSEASGFSCAVDDALAAKCRRCHTTPTRHGAPFALLTWEDAQRRFRDKPVWQHIGSAVKSGFMPYRLPANPPIEPLNDGEKRSLLEWVAAGAPRQDCTPDAGAPKRGRPRRGGTPSGT
jgi:hypothetical protein